MESDNTLDPAVVKAMIGAKGGPVRVIGLPVEGQTNLIGPYIFDSRIDKVQGVPLAQAILLADLLDCEFLTLDSRTDSDVVARTLVAGAAGAVLGGAPGGIVGALLAAATASSTKQHTIYIKDRRDIVFAIECDKTVAGLLLPIANGSLKRTFRPEDLNKHFLEQHQKVLEHKQKLNATNKKVGIGCAVVFGILILIVIIGNVTESMN